MTQNCRPARCPERATANKAGAQPKNEDYGRFLRDGSYKLPPSTSSSLSNAMTETFVNTVYEDDEDDESVESNDDAARRDIEHQQMRRLDIAVGTGTHVSKYDQRDAR